MADIDLQNWKWAVKTKLLLITSQIHQFFYRQIFFRTVIGYNDFFTAKLMDNQWVHKLRLYVPA